MAILLLKALRDKDFHHKLPQMSLFFSSDLHKFKLETQVKTLTHIVDEKHVAIKDAITIFFFYLGFLSRTFTIHRTAGEGGGYLFNSFLPLPPASQTLRY